MLMLGISFSASAEESTATQVIATEGGGVLQDGRENIFENTYKLLEANADKIFSALAFIGTLIVGIGYKSGLIPLLREALSKLKNAIDGVKADGEEAKALTNEKLLLLASRLDDISTTLEKEDLELEKIGTQLEDYEEFKAERESMRLILSGQIDMLYAIFMSSALPQYQKDEVGERISAMREELSAYEASAEE